MKDRFSLYLLLLISSVSQAQTHEWFSLSEEVNESVTDLTIFQGKLIVAGAFTQTGTVSNNNIAAWDGANWSNLGTGFPATMTSVVNEIIVHSDSLFVVGLEMTSGGIVVTNKIEVWDGMNWTNIGQANDIINTIEIYDGEVYVAGKFDTIDGIQAKGIAKWNGSVWENLGDGLRYNSIYSNVIDLHVYDNVLFATGIIDSAGDISCEGVAFWNGSTWLTIPSASFLSNYNMFMVEWNGELLFGSTAYVGPDYLSVDIFRWDGIAFSLFSSQNMSYVLDFEIHEGNLYCSGGNVFDYGSTVRLWDGSNWVTIGTGLMSDVDAICSFNGELYAGGWFNETNGSDHNFLARYAELNSVGELSDKVEFKFFPNPTHSYTNFSFVLRERAELSIDIIDSQGRTVKTLGTKMFNQGEQQILLDLTDLIHGIYFVKVGINDNVYFEQIVKLQN
jgi:hypothetical protein